MKFERILYLFFSTYQQDPRLDKQLELFCNKGASIRFLLKAFYRNSDYKPPEKVDFISIHDEYNKKFTFPLEINPFWKSFITNHIIDFKPDLIIVREMFFAKTVANIASKSGIPVIMDMAENYPAAMKAWKKYNNNPLTKFVINKLKYADRIEREAVELMDGIVVVCDEQIQRLNKVYGFPKEKMVSIHNVPFADFGKEKISKKNEVPVFIHHGNMTSEKSLTEFIKACRIVKNKGYSFEVLLPGFGDCEDDYKKLVSELGLVSNFKFLGRYMNKDLYKFLQIADIGVIPYQLNDFNNYTIHNKLFEYFAFGIPVLSTPMVPTMRLIKEFGAGIVASTDRALDIAESMINLLNRDLSEFSEAALAASKIYNWDVESRKFMDFIENIEYRGR